MPKRREKAAAASGEDRIGALPDDVLQQVLSLLPSEDVVRTCVLSRRWRHIWKSTPALRIDSSQWWSVRWLNIFVNYLMRLRDSSPLDEREISCCQFQADEADEMFCFGELWIHQAISLCQTRVLKACISTLEDRLDLYNMPFVSQHLTRVDLTDVALRNHSLDLSSCPALEDLEMNSCSICAKMILSRSLKRLSMTLCDFKFIPRTRISASSLVSLKLTDNEGFAPLLERMPSLVTAFVRLGDRCEDSCSNNYYGDCGDDRCFGCYGNDDDGDDSVLLEGLASATNLELITQPAVFIFRKDFKWCPTFSKLKTLLLSEWCMAADFSALIYFLQHAPIMEKLTLQLYKTPESVVEADGCYNPREHFLASNHLKVVDVKFNEDEVLQKVLKILSTHGVSPEKICIQKINSLSSENFSFEQTD